MYRFSLLASKTEIEALASEWRELHRRCGAAPFTDYDWIMVWWRHIGSKMGASLLVCVCRDEDRLVGVIPLCLVRKGGGRILKLAGHEVYYYRTFLAENPELAAEMWRYILACPCYDLAEVKNIHAGTAEDAFFQRCGTRIEESIVYHVEHIGLSRDELLSIHSGNTQRRIRKARKEILAQPTMSVEHTCEYPAPEPVIQFLLEQKMKWVEARGKRGVFRQKGVFDFYREIIKLAAESGKMLMYWMERDGKILGASLNFIEGKVVYGHTLAIDRSASRYRPGFYLSWEAIIWAAEHGYEESNFSEGAEEYKTRFTKKGRITHVYLYPRTLHGQILSFLYRLVLRYRRSHERG
ncbi:MAG: GNAT family N-acetyltransferase [Proteobacteria bacterium]|jgi:CelD/BcsL family acetyltransferase involved in cellulose biosynthesis|nr:GNAT family N-acetyltransferase [Alphaproteobacteria bacterium]NCC04195.1 GNAT family N-acetyltransferase [Pseudomonadota bacterium]